MSVEENSDNDSSRSENPSVDHQTNNYAAPNTLSLGQDHNVQTDDIVEDTLPGQQHGLNAITFLV